MSVVTLNPNSQVYSNAASPVGGNLVDVLKDSIDSTYVTIGATQEIIVGLDDYTYPTSNHRLHSIIIDVRGRSEVNGGAAGFTPAIGDASTFATTKDTSYGDGSSTSTTWLDATFSGSQKYAGIDNTSLNALAAGIKYAAGWSYSVTKLAVRLVIMREPGTPTWVSPSNAATVATRTPTLTWQYNRHTDDTVSVGVGVQSAFRVRIFTAAQAAIGGFNPETSPGTHDSGQVPGASASYVTPALVNGQSYVAYVKTWNQAGTWSAASPWSTGRSFTVGVVNPVPTSVTPSASSVQTTSQPALGASAASVGSPLRREWQFATNSGFSTGVFSVLESGTGSNAPTGVIAWPDETLRLAQGTWWVRARVRDVDGTYGAYSSGQTFTVSHPPTTTGRQPSGNSAVPFNGGSLTLSWQFSDADIADDYQTKYRVQLWPVSEPANILDSGLLTDSDQFHTFTGISSAWKNIELRWKVLVHDRDNVTGGYSPETALTLRDTPVPTITFPGNGAVINSPSPLVVWDYTSASGLAQSQWKVDIYNTTANPDVLLATSGWQRGTGTAWQCPSPIVAVGPTHAAVVTVIDEGGLTGSDTNSFTATYIAPTPPPLVVDSSDYAVQGVRHLDWSSATTDTGWYSWRVYRRPEGVGSWELLHETFDMTEKTYDDYRAPSQVAVQYVVTQTAVSFAQLVESIFVPSATQQDLLNHYMVVVPSDPSLNFTLYHVTSESFSDEQEQAVINLMGRGRRYEYGTHFGQSGSLDVELRDVDNGPTARAQRLAIEMLRNSDAEAFLLNPFGDVWRVALMTANFSRISGTGLHEMMTVSIDYQEVGLPTLTAALTAEKPPPIPVTASAQWGGMNARATRTTGTVVATATWGAWSAVLNAGPGGGSVVNAILVPYNNKIWWGATTAAIDSQSSTAAGLTLYEQTMPSPDIIHFYRTNGDAFFTTEHKNMLVRSGKPRAIARYDWKVSTTDTWAAIGNGSQDARLATAAAQMKAYPYKFFLCFNHEPDNDAVVAGRSDADYADMFQYCTNFLRNEGVTNMITVLTFTGWSGNKNRWDGMYPGDDIVDWISFNPYAHTADLLSELFNEAQQASGYTGSNPPYTGWYDWATKKAPGKPIMLSEWAMGGDCDSYGTLLTQMASQLTTVYPAIKAMLLWNDVTAERDEQTQISATGGTSGNFRFNWGGSIATLNYNSTASQAATAINAMNSLGATSTRPAGRVTVTGGPLNTSPLVVTWSHGLRGSDVPTPTVSNSTVVGATPTISTPRQGLVANNFMNATIDVPVGATRPAGIIAAMNTLASNSIFQIDTALVP